MFRALPAGDYQISFDLSSFAPLKRTTTVPLGGNIVENVTMTPGGRDRGGERRGRRRRLRSPRPVVGLNIKHDEVEALATSRTLQGIATLSPGLTENTPNAGQVVINGAFAFDNVFMLNGVDVNDNLFGSPQNLFIEDAIEETQVLTSGISAEYGRFSGGVVNAITKSGGNIVLRQLSSEPDQPGLGRRNAVRGVERHARTRAIQPEPRGHLRRSDRQGSAVVLHRRTPLEHRHPSEPRSDRRSVHARRTTTSAARSSSRPP